MSQVRAVANLKVTGVSVTDFIQKDTTLQAFYNFITMSNTYFEFDIHAKGRGGRTALHVAAARGNVELTRTLLQMGASHRQLREPAITAMIDAVYHGQLECVKLLYQHGARFSQLMNDTAYPTLYLWTMANATPEIKAFADSVMTAQEKKLASLDREQAHRLDAETCAAESALVEAVKEGNYYAAKRLLSRYEIDLYNLDFGNHIYGGTRIPALKNDLNMVKLLVANGGDLLDAKMSFIPGTIPDNARELGYTNVADFLEGEQRRRIEVLKEAANQQLISHPQQKKLRRSSRIYAMGLFELLDMPTDLQAALDQASAASYKHRY